MKKNYKKHQNLTQVGVEQPCVSEFTALPSSPSYSLTLDQKFYIKGKPCPATHNFKMLDGQMGTFDLWITSLPLYHLSHANHVDLRDC
jgi:hypothetical protein